MRQTPETEPSIQEMRARQVELFTNYLDSLVRNLESQLAESSTDTIGVSKKDLGDLRQAVDIVIDSYQQSEARANRLKEELLNTLADRHYIPQNTLETDLEIGLFFQET